MSRNQPFQRVAGLKPGRSVFNLSYRRLFDAHAGWLLPCACDETVPGDTWKISTEVLIRLNPTLAPVIHEINAYVHYFFVPYRILWDGWEQFITGGEDGQDESTLPTWNPTDWSRYSLWDYFGFSNGDLAPPPDIKPMDMPLRAYNMCFNYYYRDQNVTPEYDLLDENIKLRAYERDYFSASLPFQQRGIAPALPLTGQINLSLGNEVQSGSQQAGVLNVGEATPGGIPNAVGVGAAANFNDWFRSHYVDMNDAATFDVSDLRTAFQIQKWLERNARAGVRYQEFLRSHFGYSATDQRLNYPEYLFGSKVAIILSEVLQTSATPTDPSLAPGSTPQGNLAGHGIASSRKSVGTFRAPEFCLILGIFSILPRTSYSQGINRQWLRQTRYDFYFPEFSHLSEQPVQNVEIFASDQAGTNLGTFGYVGRYDEMRTKQDDEAGAMKVNGSLGYWHLGRQFQNQPTLNEEFIYCKGESAENQRIFAVRTEPNYICHVGHKITAIRPMPLEGTPGYIDHN